MVAIALYFNPGLPIVIVRKIYVISRKTRDYHVTICTEHGTTSMFILLDKNVLYWRIADIYRYTVSGCDWLYSVSFLKM